jgi:hypothetical protein
MKTIKFENGAKVFKFGSGWFMSPMLGLKYSGLKNYKLSDRHAEWAAKFPEGGEQYHGIVEAYNIAPLHSAVARYETNTEGFRLLDTAVYHSDGYWVVWVGAELLCAVSPFVYELAQAEGLGIYALDDGQRPTIMWLAKDGVCYGVLTPKFLWLDKPNDDSWRAEPPAKEVKKRGLPLLVVAPKGIGLQEWRWNDEWVGGQCSMYKRDAIKKSALPPIVQEIMAAGKSNRSDGKGALEPREMNTKDIVAKYHKHGAFALAYAGKEGKLHKYRHETFDVTMFMHDDFFRVVKREGFVVQFLDDQRPPMIFALLHPEDYVPVGFIAASMVGGKK